MTSRIGCVNSPWSARWACCGDPFEHTPHDSGHAERTLSPSEASSQNAISAKHPAGTPSTSRPVPVPTVSWQSRATRGAAIRLAGEGEDEHVLHVSRHSSDWPYSGVLMQPGSLVASQLQLIPNTAHAALSTHTIGVVHAALSTQRGASEGAKSQRAAEPCNKTPVLFQT